MTIAEGATYHSVAEPGIRRKVATILPASTVIGTARRDAVHAVHSEEAPYQYLRRAIASGALMPSERLVEGDLADTLGFSRAAVRVAIVRLAQEGLVERLPHRGARVRRISEHEAVDLLEARMALECHAAERAAHKATRADIQRLRTILAAMEDAIHNNLAGYGKLNAQLHAEIVRIADNLVAARILDDLRSQYTVFHVRHAPVPRDPFDRLKQHRAIVEAIAAHDIEGASSAMRLHLSNIPTWMRAQRAAQ